MTSHFDHLNSICYEVHNYDPEKRKPEFEGVALWLAEICRKQADDKEPKWNFEVWKTTHMGKLYTKTEGKWAVFNYLNDCHDILDHRNWHLRVFDPATACLIRIVDSIIEGKDEYGIADFKLLKRFPELKEHLEKVGFTYVKEKYRRFRFEKPRENPKSKWDAMQVIT